MTERWSITDLVRVAPDRYRLRPTRPEPSRPRPVYASKLEQAYADRLDLALRHGELRRWQYEALTFRLAARTRYTPDFFVVRPDGSLELHEVKGRPREDAMVKLRIAASLFPEFQWWLVRYRSGQWHLDRIAS